jgi:hypothetical protein
MALIADSEQKAMRERLKSLGVAFALPLADAPADPEETILDCLKYYWRYNDFFFFCYTLLRFDLGPRVNVDRLIALTEKRRLDNDELILLLALCRKIAAHGAPDFEKVVAKFHHPDLTMKSPPEDEDSAWLIHQWGVEESLEIYGVRVRSFYLERKDKIFRPEITLEKNLWLKIRSVLGSNFKADIAFFKLSGQALCAEDAANLAGCSLPEAVRHWKTLLAIDSVQKLVA